MKILLYCFLMMSFSTFAFADESEPLSNNSKAQNAQVKDNYCGRNARLSSCDSTSCGNFDVQVDALYWRTATSYKFYALTATNIIGPGQETDTLHAVKPHNDWGGRIKLGYLCPKSCLFGNLQYAYFRQTLHDHVTDPLEVSYFGDTIDQFSSISATVVDEYQRGGGRLGYYFIDKPCANVFVNGGIDWLFLKEQDRLKGTETGDGVFKLNQRKTYSSAAFSVGAGANLYLWCGFGFAGEANAVAAVGARRTRFTSNTTVSIDSVKNVIAKQTTVVPGYDFRLEAFWESPQFKLACFRLAVGYEQHYFFDALLGNRLYFGPAGQDFFPSQFQETQNLGFGGLYLSAQARF